MAIYRAWMLATAGRAVTLLTHSNLLHQYLGQLAPDLTEALDVTTYHRWIRKFWCEHFETDLPKIDDDGWNYDWVEMQRNCIRKKVRSAAHLVIDEGQNLPVGLYQFCRIIGIDITIIADQNEPIGDDQTTVAEMCRILAVGADPIVLHENRRSTREIALLASKFAMDTRREMSLPRRGGCSPRVLRVSSLKQFLGEVRQRFDKHPEQSVGIICRSTYLLREVQGELTQLGLSKYTQAYVNGDQYRNTVDFSMRPIRILSTASMKGLEFDSVFVPDLDAYTEDPTSVEARLRFFVLCSRAREDLCFAHRGPREPAIVATIPESVLLRLTG